MLCVVFCVVCVFCVLFFVVVEVVVGVCDDAAKKRESRALLHQKFSTDFILFACRNFSVISSFSQR